MTGDDVRPTGRPAAPDARDGVSPAGDAVEMPAAASAATSATPAAVTSAAPEPAGAEAPPEVTPGRPQAAPVPDAQTLAAIATPATVRRAPRIGPFIATGAVLGAVVGWVLVLVSSGTTGEARTAVALVVTAGCAILGGLIGAALAAGADRRSTRRSARR